MGEEISGIKPDRYAGRVIVAAHASDRFNEAMFTPSYWYEHGAVVGSAGGRGQVLFVEKDNQQWVLRHYHRGGAMRLPLKDRYFWNGAEQTRSLLEWRLLAEMSAEGLPVPRPVAARFIRHGLFYQADLLTERIPHARPFSAVVADRLPDTSEWAAIGSCIRRLHDAGIYHADLNAHNILISDEDGEIFIIDFDRGRRRAGGSWKKSNLKRLNRSLHKIGVSLSTPEFEEKQWPSLVAGYQSNQL